MNSKILLVHTGTQFPDYINDCILQLKKYDIEVHLILSENLHNFIENKNNLIVAKAEDYMDERYKNFVVNRDPSFRDGFWTRTSSRFFLLHQYSKINNIENFFHIENDVLVFTDFIHENNVLQNSENKMALVVDSPKRCVPSIIWFKDSSIIEELCEFIFKNPSEDDMKNLFLFFCLNRKKITNFPILPNLSLFDNLFVNYDNMFEKFESIFDGAALGQFLGGVDPRNVPGDTSGFINETTVFNASLFIYKWFKGEPYLEYNKRLYKINNLHIHSKNLKKFM